MDEDTIIVVVIIGVFLAWVTLIVVLSRNPKIRAKSMGIKVKAAKYLIDENKDDLKAITDAMAQSGFLQNNNKTDNYNNNEVRFCKYCGRNIDADSVFCKYCGKQQL